MMRPLIRTMAVLALIFAIPALQGQPLTKMSAQKPDIKADLLIGHPEADGRELWVGVRLNLGSGWKTYWKSPGDAGLPTEFDWSGSSNIADAEVNWPAPSRLSILGFETIGYTHEVLFPVRIKVLDPGTETRIRLKLAIYACSTICIREERVLAATIQPGASGDFQATIDSWRSRVPQATSSVLSVLSVERSMTGQASLQIEVASTRPLLEPDVFVEGDPPLERRQADRHLRSRQSGDSDREFARRDRRNPSDAPSDRNHRVRRRGSVGGVARAAGKRGRCNRFGASSTGAGCSGQSSRSHRHRACGRIYFEPHALRVSGALAEASFVRSRQHRRSRSGSQGICGFGRRHHGVLSAAGGRAGRHEVGWRQRRMGHPVSTAVVSRRNGRRPVAVRSEPVRALSPRGIFGLSYAGKRHRRRHVGDAHFLSGFVATLLATPCSAPLVGTAVGFALSQGTAEIFAIFAALGIGMASPYLLVAAFPAIDESCPAARAVAGLCQTALRRGAAGDGGLAPAWCLERWPADSLRSRSARHWPWDSPASACRRGIAL